MKNKLAFLIMFGCILLYGLILISCDNSNTITDNSAKHGSLTIINLPENYTLGFGFVNENPSYSDWSYDDTGIIADPQTWGPTEIGYFTNEINGVRAPSNAIWIFGNNDASGRPTSFKFTGLSSVLIYIGIPTYPYLRSYGINNVWFSDGKATINFASFRLTLPATDGKFNLIEANEFNGKYAILYGTYGEANPNVIYGFNNATSFTDFKGHLIENGEVAIPLYQITFGDNKFMAFNRTGDVIQIVIIIMEAEDFDYLDFGQVFADPLQTKYKCLIFSEIAYSNGVIFANGVGGAKVAEGVKFPDGVWPW